MKIFSWDDVLHSRVKEFIHCFSSDSGLSSNSGENESGICGGWGSALTVGGFDGPHRGHEALCASVIKEAHNRNLVPGLITFTRSPRSFKQRADYEGDISALRLRLKVLEEWGFAFAVVIDFSADFSKMEGYEFLCVLKDLCAMRFFGVGEGFRCGRNHAAGEDEISSFAQEHGIVCSFMPLQTESGTRISSSLVRRFLRSGRFKDAQELLGHPFQIDCFQFDTKFEQTAGELYAVMTAKPDAALQLIPPPGTYPVHVYAFCAGEPICFDTDVHTDAFTLRQKVPAVYKNCLFDRIRF
ncbi:FAD synthetase family protein [Treponema sp. HNW]|uniref:FAD synthetase family protein n=1 Tax=Treponema sp. HNW TaxID=3116654 RepID=UPI003D0EE9CE